MHIAIILILGGNIDYKYGTSDNFSVPKQSCDLITVAQALHWFNLDLFFDEVNRALKPKGRLAVFGYGMCSIDDPDLDTDLKSYYFDTLGSSKEPGEPGCFWQISRPSIFCSYALTPIEIDVRVCETWGKYNCWITKF